MSTRARVEYDPPTQGVRVAISRRLGGDPAQVFVYTWNQPDLEVMDLQQADQLPDSPEHWLRLDEAAALALYEELGRYFGKIVTDTTLLTKILEKEQARVDKLIGRISNKFMGSGT